jgi:hypothetical protein
MRIRARLRTLASRALSETIDVNTMIHMTRRLLGNYDLHQRTGFPTSVPIPNKTAARQLVDDIAEGGLFLKFVELLLEVERLGMMGHKYRFSRLPDIIRELRDMGYVFDKETRTFVEDTAVLTTRNWGVLKPGESYIMAFLGVDVAGNSKLVKAHGSKFMSVIYAWVREMVSRCAQKRNGRLWGWEGDGGIVAFTFEEQNLRATLSAIEMLNELFVYNVSECPLEGGLHLRITVHNGPCEYAENGSELKADTIKRLWDIDTKFGEEDTLIVTDTVTPSLDSTLLARFEPLEVARDQTYYTYAVRLGTP